MAPTALWVALIVGLELWTTGHTVPAQVSDSRGQPCITKRPILHNSGTAREIIPSPTDTRHAPLGTHGDPKPGTLDWNSGPSNLMVQKRPVALSARMRTAMGARAGNPQPGLGAPFLPVTLRIPFCAPHAWGGKVKSGTGRWRQISHCPTARAACSSEERLPSVCRRLIISFLETLGLLVVVRARV